MKTTTISFVALVVAGSFVVACSGAEDAKDSSTKPSSKGTSSSSSSSSGSTGDDKTGTDTEKTEPQVCVKAGDKGNDKGVGAYCEKSTECKTGLLCTKDFGAGPDEPWFCTTPCDDDTACGAGAKCFAEARGKGCVPQACLP